MNRWNLCRLILSNWIKTLLEVSTMIGSRSAVSLAATAFFLFQVGGFHRSCFPVTAAPSAGKAVPALPLGAQGPPAETRQAGQFMFRYDGAQLTDFIQTVGAALGISPIQIDPDVQGKVTVGTDTALSREAMRRIFDGVLNDNHAVLRRSGSVYRVTRLEVPGMASGGDSATPKPPQREPVRVAGNVQASRLIFRVEPVYPDLALRARVEGTSLLEVTINEQGDVALVRGIRSGNPLLLPAAFDAVKQWRYLPTCVDGETVPVVTTVAVSFTLPLAPPGVVTAKAEPAVTEGLPRTPVRVMREQQASRLAYLVEPDYSEEARKERLAGSVWLDVMVNEFGQVSDVKFLCGNPLVEQAVIDAVKQWRYVPAHVNGAAIPVVATVHMLFDR
jgi:TonB family protein